MTEARRQRLEQHLAKLRAAGKGPETQVREEAPELRRGYRDKVVIGLPTTTGRTKR